MEYPHTCIYKGRDVPAPQLYDWGPEKRTLDSLLREVRVFNLVSGSTWASKREKIRSMLRKGTLTYDMVKDLPDLGVVNPEPYGAQRGRLGLIRKTTAGNEIPGQVLPNDRRYVGTLDPEASLPGRVKRAAKGAVRGVKRLGKRAMTYFSSDGKRVGSLRAVRTRPLLKEWLKTLGRPDVKDSTLASRLLKMTREGREIPPHLLSPHASRFAQNVTHRLHSNEVSHHNLANPNRELSVQQFLEKVRRHVIEFFSQNLLNKCQLVLGCEMVHMGERIGLVHFRTKQHPLLESMDMEDLYQVCANELAQAMEGYTGLGSGHVISYVTGLDVTLSRCNPFDLRGSSYLPLPDKVRLTKAVVNMKNKDDECFKWSVGRALNMVDVHPERITPLLRRQVGELDWSAIKFPSEPNKTGIDKFEETNDVSVCIFGFEDNRYVPVRLPKKEYSRNVDLFYFGDKTGKMHYAVVKSLSRLLSSSVSKHRTSTYICRRCLCNLHSRQRLEEHARFCSRQEPTKTVMPKEGSVQKFRAHRKTIRQPVVVYYEHIPVPFWHGYHF